MSDQFHIVTVSCLQRSVLSFACYENTTYTAPRTHTHTHTHTHKKRSMLLQKPDFHFQIRFEVLILYVLLNGREGLIASIVVVFEKLLRVLDPHAVVAAAHTAAGG